MKRPYLKIALALFSLITIPAWAEEAFELTPLVQDFAVPVEQMEDPVEEPALDLLGFAQNCLVTAPQCPTGSQVCDGKPLGSSCGNGGVCFGLCSTPFVGTVCSCLSFGANAEGESEAAFLAQLSATDCKANNDSEKAK